MSYKDDLLQKLIEGSERGRLPALQEETVSGFLDTIKKEIGKLLESFRGLFESLFGSVNLNSSWDILKTAIIVAAVICIFYLIFIVIKNLRSPNSALREAILAPTEEYESDLESLLKESIAKNEWKRAMRICWLAFTQEEGLPSSYTPLLYARETKQPFNENIYRHMFGKINTDAGKYEAYSKSLKPKKGN